MTCAPLLAAVPADFAILRITRHFGAMIFTPAAVLAAFSAADALLGMEAGGNKRLVAVGTVALVSFHLHLSDRSAQTYWTAASEVEEQWPLCM
ncbi:MAG: hypothetical protein ACRD1R_05850 [Acidobacteriota bacterium]